MCVFIITHPLITDVVVGERMDGGDVTLEGQQDQN